MPARRCGRFEIKNELGKGSMATVYEAVDPATGEKAAVKVFAPDKSLTPSQLAELRARFERESRVLLSVDHPNVVKVFEAGVADGSEYIAMEFLDGFNLKELMEMGTVFKYADALDIVSQVGMGLMACHRAGVVHRDIKPANIVKLLTGGIKITDFGIARLTTDATLAQADTRVGAPNYMSPEQIQGLPVDERSDVFSLGVVMYEMLTRHKPFEGDTITTIMYNVTHVQPPTPLFYDPHLPRATEKVIFKALAKERSLRYQTIQEFVDDVRKLAVYKLVMTSGTLIGTVAAAKRGFAVPDEKVIYCVDCGMSNPVEVDECARCGRPLVRRADAADQFPSGVRMAHLYTPGEQTPTFFNWGAFLLPLPWCIAMRMWTWTVALIIIPVCILILGLLFSSVTSTTVVTLGGGVIGPVDSPWGAYAGPIALISLFYSGVSIYLGIAGSILAWQSRPFASLDEFRKVQLAWAGAGVVVSILFMIWSVHLVAVALSNLGLTSGVP